MTGPHPECCFSSVCGTKFEHIVPASESHASGLCATDAGRSPRLVLGLRNLALASPPFAGHSLNALGAHARSDSDADPVSSGLKVATRVRVYSLPMRPGTSRLDVPAPRRRLTEERVLRLRACVGSTPSRDSASPSGVPSRPPGRTA